MKTGILAIGLLCLAAIISAFGQQGGTNQNGGGGTPGGVSGQVQYNNAGAFGGIDPSNFTINGSGILLGMVLGKASVIGSNGLTVIGVGLGGKYSVGSSNQANFSIVGASAHDLAVVERGTCTMAAGTCTFTWPTAFANTPICLATWNGTGALTGFVKGVPSTTTCVITSSVNTDTGVMQVLGIGQPN